MNLYTKIVSGLLFPVHETLKGHDTVRVRRALERSQWLSRDALERLRLARLRALLDRAASRVPYYRQVFSAHGFDPAALRDSAELTRLPFLTKALIREHADALQATDARHLAAMSTGGSTGEPLRFFLGRERVTHDVAAKWRATRWWGVDIGDREAVLWGSPIELGAQDRVRVLRDRLFRTRLFPAFEMRDDRQDEYLAALRAMRPAMLFGYPSAIALLARRARERALRMDDCGIRVAFVTAERLDPEDRALIGAVFGCQVANGYGGRDAGFIAHECPAGGMHLTAEDVIVEIVDEAGAPCPAGVAGEIVVTHLASGDFPFIRYRTGDIAVLDDRLCACGRTLPLIREIQGRSTDFVVAVDGTVMHGLSVIYVLRELTGIERFRIEQEDLTHTRVLVVPGASFGQAQEDAIRAGLKARLGASVNVTVERVAHIPPERSGKYRYVVSRVVRP